MPRNKFWVKSIAFTLFVLMICMSSINITSKTILKEIKATNSFREEGIDWWPMFHHDLSNSGYSTSDAPDTNAILWIYTTGNRVESSPAVSDGKVYFGSDDGNVYCLDADNGNMIWSFKITGFFNSVRSSPAVSDGKVYFGSTDDNLYCLDANNGNKKWSFKTGGFVHYSSPAVSDGKVYFGSWDKKVYCLNADNGNEIWNYFTGDMIESSPAVADGKVYINSKGTLEDKNVHCLDADNGNKIWSYETIIAVSSPAVSDGKVYFGSWDRNVHCLNADNGTKIWSKYIDDMIESSPAVADGKVYIGSGMYGPPSEPDHNKMYCLNADNGTEIWSYHVDGGVKSSPAVADGKVYFGSLDHNVYCLNADNGNKIWSYETGGYVYYSSPAISDGKVYISSTDGKVYCFSDSGNHPPNKPTISGPTSGKPRIEYTYIANATDYEGDRIKYLFDWGDGTSTWTDYHASGEPVEVSHKWILQGNYNIKVKAKEDTFGYESAWETLSVSMPRNRAIERPFFNFLENYPNMFPILRRLLLLIN